MIYLTSDSHFGHANIIKYASRPFNNVLEMDATLINNWNNKVNKNDTVYHLGDFAFKNPEIYLSRLKGKIIFTTGDHDKALIKCISRGNYPNVTLYDKKVLEIIYKNTIKIYALHWCIRTWPKSHYNSIHIYGHSHGLLEPIGKAWDVGVDNNDYQLLSIEDIINIMRDRPDNPNLIKQ